MWWLMIVLHLWHDLSHRACHGRNLGLILLPKAYSVTHGVRQRQWWGLWSRKLNQGWAWGTCISRWTSSDLRVWICPFLFQLSIDSLALKSQGPSSPSSPASCGFIPSISQVWSSPTSSPDNGPPPEFRDWHPTSQISQFLNDLNYVPMHLAPLDVLEYHGKEDIEHERVEGGEQCQLEDLDEEFVCKVSTMCPLTGVCYVMLTLVRFLFLFLSPVKSFRMAQFNQPRSHTHRRCHRPHSSIQVTLESPCKLENVLERRLYKSQKKSIYSHLCGLVSWGSTDGWWWYLTSTIQSWINFLVRFIILHS
jgi:hypothetical protein